MRFRDFRVSFQISKPKFTETPLDCHYIILFGAYDERTESQICNLIFHKECTCLIITHNLKIAAKCDRIFAMNNGRINEVTDDSLKRGESL